MSLDHEARKLTIGASEIAAVLGLNEWMSPLDVWEIKTGRKPPFEGNAHTERGNLQEPMILDWLQRELGRRIATDCPSILHSGGLASATPDGFVLISDKNIAVEHWVGGPIVDDTEAIWELYKTDQSLFSLELCEAKSTLKTVNDISEVPHFWLQCQWQMMCTGLKKCHLALFGPMVSNYQRFEITYNEPFMLEKLKEAELWWEKHIVGDVRPDPINEADILNLYPQDDGTSIVAVDSLYRAITQHTALKARAKDIQSAIDPIRESIVLAIGKAEKVRYNGRVVASYKTDSRGVRTFRTY